jgi:cytochrome c-type protein NapB
VVLGVSLIGFLRGTSTEDYAFVAPVRVVDADPFAHDAPFAVPYLEMRRSPRGDGPTLPDDLARLASAIPTRDQPASLDGTDKGDAIDAREARRAYHGAPPVIPHPAGQGGAPECLACHDGGVRFGALRAPGYPHERLTSCTQCHAMAEPDPPWGRRSEGLAVDPRDVPSQFRGEPTPPAGPRWTDISPPTIPHATVMHERCISCHGPNGRDALKSTHPQRQNCEQCHAPRVQLDQRPGSAGRSPSP